MATKVTSITSATPISDMEMSSKHQSRRSSVDWDLVLYWLGLPQNTYIPATRKGSMPWATQRRTSRKPTGPMFVTVVHVKPQNSSLEAPLLPSAASSTSSLLTDDDNNDVAMEKSPATYAQAPAHESRKMKTTPEKRTWSRKGKNYSAWTYINVALSRTG